VRAGGEHCPQRTSTKVAASRTGHRGKKRGQSPLKGHPAAVQTASTDVAAARTGHRGKKRWQSPLNGHPAAAIGWIAPSRNPAAAAGGGCRRPALPAATATQITKGKGARTPRGRDEKRANCPERTSTIRRRLQEAPRRQRPLTPPEPNGGRAEKARARRRAQSVTRDVQARATPATIGGGRQAGGGTVASPRTSACGGWPSAGNQSPHAHHSSPKHSACGPTGRMAAVPRSRQPVLVRDRTRQGDDARHGGQSLAGPDSCLRLSGQLARAADAKRLRASRPPADPAATATRPPSEVHLSCAVAQFCGSVSQPPPAKRCLPHRLTQDSCRARPAMPGERYVGSDNARSAAGPYIIGGQNEPPQATIGVERLPLMAGPTISLAALLAIFDALLTDLRRLLPTLCSGHWSKFSRHQWLIPHCLFALCTAR